MDEPTDDSSIVESIALPRRRDGWLAKLFTFGLFLAIALLIVRLASNARESTALSRELSGLRAQAGHLDVTDHEKVYAIRLKTGEPNEWVWRLHLPKSQKYQCSIYVGPANEVPISWGVPSTRNSQSRSIGNYGISSGEYALHGKLEPTNSVVLFSLKKLDDKFAITGRIFPPNESVVDQNRTETSDFPATGQREFAAYGQVKLLQLTGDSAAGKEQQGSNSRTFLIVITPRPTNSK